ncbi:MAG: hypothetical protein JOY62_04410 [Acidobacteriaceae bacterium]|nr:hypothetical protein [Acidobacteriaceae bacterium]MBV9779197.1 hypothetical protein [Acidobacteriaceae bacterium]
MKSRNLIFASVCTAAIVFACGIDVGPFFEPDDFPEDETAFRRGNLGLLTPALNKTDELIAFRYLSGLTFENPDAITDPQRPSTPGGEENELGINVWMKARKEVSDLPAPGYISTYRTNRLSGEYVYYENCLDDSFITAARTLRDRRQKYASAPAFRDWVQAQDQVFQNCGGDKNPLYPADAATGASDLVRADRRYQIAAAHFYAQDLETAARLFTEIGEDAKSPWQNIGHYMVGRTLLREVSLQKNAGARDAARRQFQEIADNPAAGSLRDSARGLLEHLAAIDHSSQTVVAISKQLTAPHASASFNDTLREARYVLLADSFHPALSGPDIPEPFDWVQTLENGTAQHALDQWQTRHSLPWLTLALIYTNGKDELTPELIKEAGRLPSTSPAFATATYNAIRLRIERGEINEPREQVERLLKEDTKQPASVINPWRAERMRLATSFDDLLSWATRTPLYASLYTNDANAGSPVLAEDSTYLLNYRVPLVKLAEAAHSKRLPPWSAADVALAAWTRAFMLENRTVMRDMAPIIAKQHPDWSPKLIPPSGTGFEAWKFQAALLVASNSAFQPLVPVDYRRHISQGSWWCAISRPVWNQPGPEPPSIAWCLPAIFEPGEPVISKTEGNRADEEIERLERMGSAQSVVGPIILRWAKSHPEDPLVPFSLHRVVRVVRYGCGVDPANGEISKSAFDLLHKRYPKNEWTAKTPYWFK